MKRTSLLLVSLLYLTAVAWSQNDPDKPMLLRHKRLYVILDGDRAYCEFFVEHKETYFSGWDTLTREGSVYLGRRSRLRGGPDGYVLDTHTRLIFEGTLHKGRKKHYRVHLASAAEKLIWEGLHAKTGPVRKHHWAVPYVWQ